MIIFAFFLPWVRACGYDLSGYDLATHDIVEDAWVYWLTLISAIVCLVLSYTVDSADVATRIKAAVARLVAGLVGFLPILNIWYNIQQGPDEILFGGWLTSLGYLGVFASFFMDVVSSTTQRSGRKSFSTPSSPKQPARPRSPSNSRRNKPPKPPSR